MSTITVSVQMIEAALRHFAGEDGSLAELFRRHGVPQGLLEQNQARISAENYSGLLQSIMIAMGDEMLGYTRVPHRLGTWKMMCHAVITAETLGEALRRYCHFFRLFDWRMVARLRVENGEAILYLEPTDPSRITRTFPRSSTTTALPAGWWIIPFPFWASISVFQPPSTRRSSGPCSGMHRCAVISR